MSGKKLKMYIAGGMSGYEDNNFPAFDRARDLVNANTEYEAISPADLDRQSGFDGSVEVTGEDFKKIMWDDLVALNDCDAIGLLQGWELSRGARLEAHFARVFGLDIFRIQTRTNRDGEDRLILDYLDPTALPDGVNPPNVTA